MGHHRFIAWIREEITSTKVVMYKTVVGYEERLEPNPAMGVSEGTLLPTTADGMYEIHQDPIYADVPRTVLDERRASDAAEALVALILSDEQYLYLAEALMGAQEVFAPHWERLRLLGRARRTKHVALNRLGRTPAQLLIKGLGSMTVTLLVLLTFLYQFCLTVCFCAWMFYLIWPGSRAGMWIATMVKRILAEARGIIYD